MSISDNTTIKGNGLIGSALYQHAASFHRANLCVIAAGVSNSKCTDLKEFQREESMINHSIDSALRHQQRLLYISTYSVHDKSLASTPYVQFRMKNEGRIIQASPENAILRLTNIVGSQGNPTNILNFLHNAVSNNHHIKAWRQAQRNFVDVKDVGKFIEWALESDQCKGILELVHPDTYSIPRTIELLEEHLNKSANVSWVNSSENEFERNILSQKFFSSLQSQTEDGYFKNILNTYYPT
jgi:nucleoside-diphosphate-sugar epimerase